MIFNFLYRRIKTFENMMPQTTNILKAKDQKFRYIFLSYFGLLAKNHLSQVVMYNPRTIFFSAFDSCEKEMCFQLSFHEKLDSKNPQKFIEMTY
ncbi:hypothetical protein Avbf_01558 [Armadillidium vulgare]|nr:hypothetical protein Avbf_01558 [Armadillidium vulgare]